MGRPKLKTARDRQFNIALTEDELAKVQRAARLIGMRPADYGRSRLLAKALRGLRTDISVRQLDPLLLVQLARVGNNLNQITRGLHALAVPAPEDLAPLLLEIRAILKTVAAQ